MEYNFGLKLVNVAVVLQKTRIFSPSYEQIFKTISAKTFNNFKASFNHHVIFTPN